MAFSLMNTVYNHVTRPTPVTPDHEKSVIEHEMDATFRTFPLEEQAQFFIAYFNHVFEWIDGTYGMLESKPVVPAEDACWRMPVYSMDVFFDKLHEGVEVVCMGQQARAVSDLVIEHFRDARPSLVIRDAIRND